jgi:hypothetical protein
VDIRIPHAEESFSRFDLIVWDLDDPQKLPDEVRMAGADDHENSQ